MEPCIINNFSNYAGVVHLCPTTYVGSSDSDSDFTEIIEDRLNSSLSPSSLSSGLNKFDLVKPINLIDQIPININFIQSSNQSKIITSSLDMPTSSTDLSPIVIHSDTTIEKLIPSADLINFEYPDAITISKSCEESSDSQSSVLETHVYTDSASDSIVLMDTESIDQVNLEEVLQVIDSPCTLPSAHLETVCTLSHVSHVTASLTRAILQGRLLTTMVDSGATSSCISSK